MKTIEKLHKKAMIADFKTYLKNALTTDIQNKDVVMEWFKMNGWRNTFENSLILNDVLCKYVSRYFTTFKRIRKFQREMRKA